uniref:NYN domain-containing protein n=1 Tax=Mycena chlorophos TaxID=658473 RepID=A0ABQ0MDQ6_MYCCL|nr:predicted protein [Mycena chlorophos]
MDLHAFSETAMIYIEKLRVRPKKYQPYNMCGPQLAAMLGCWAATSDVQNHTACKEAAEVLFHCMRTTPLPKKSHKPTINYHLARLENCHASATISGYQVASNIRNVAHRFGKIVCFKAYLEVSDTTSRTMALRSELQSSGVSLTDCQHHGRRAMLMVDMLVHAMDHPHTTFILISGDRELSYAVSILRLRKYQVFVISVSAHASLTSQASAWLDWNKHIMGSPPTESSSSTASSPTTRPPELNGVASSPQLTSFDPFRSASPTVRPSRTVFGSPTPRSPQLDAAPSYRTDISHASDADPMTSPKGKDVQPPPRPASTPAVVVVEYETPKPEPGVYRAQSFNAPMSAPAPTSFFPPPPEFPSVVVEEWTPKTFHTSMLNSPSPPPQPVPSTSTNTSVANPVSTRSMFEPLLAVLESHKLNGYPRPLLTIVGQELAKSVYERAGAQSFAQYTTLAEQSGFVEMGGANGYAWIALKPQTQPVPTTVPTPSPAAPVARPSSSKTSPAKIQSSTIVKGTVPPTFQPLVDALLKLRARGFVKPLRSQIGAEIVNAPAVYAAAGVKQFRNYTGLAEQARIVQMGGSQGEEWIALHSSLLGA